MFDPTPTRQKKKRVADLTKIKKEGKKNHKIRQYDFLKLKIQLIQTEF